MKQLRGGISVVIGLSILVMTATGATFTTRPAQGYVLGSVILALGMFRIFRAMRQ